MLTFCSKIHKVSCTHGFVLNASIYNEDSKKSDFEIEELINLTHDSNDTNYYHAYVVYAYSPFFFPKQDFISIKSVLS